MAMITRSYRITGRVQGVFFRSSVCDMALQLGIQGFVENKPDGSVFVLARGTEDAHEQLAEWLHEGPRLASVESVTATPSSEETGVGFYSR